MSKGSSAEAAKEARRVAEAQAAKVKKEADEKNLREQKDAVGSIKRGRFGGSSSIYGKLG